MKDAGITIVNMRATDEKSPLSWDEFHEALKADMETRTFKIVEEEKPEKKERPKKVEPSKPKKEVAPVQQEEKPEESAEIQNEKVPERLSEEDVEIVGQSTDNVAQEDEEVEEPSVEERKFETQFLYKIEKITLHIKEAGLTNWGYVKDNLQDLIRDINLNAGGWQANERE